MSILSALISGASLLYSREQAVVARETELASLRAYLFIKPVVKFIADEPPTVGVEIINGGSTPAYDVLYQLAVKFERGEGTGRFEDGLPDIDPKNRSEQHLGTRFIFKEKTESAIIPLTSKVTAEDIDALLVTGQSHMYFAAAVDYADIFGNRHKLRFCTLANGADKDSVKAQKCRLFNSSD